MIELLSEEKIRSYEYMRIQCEFNEMWDKLFLNKDRIDKVLLGKYGRFWEFSRIVSKSRLRNFPFFIKLIPKSGKTYLSFYEILQGSKLPMSRAWEYPWAILNSSISSNTRVFDVGSGKTLFPLYLARRTRYIDSMDSNKYQMQVIAPALADILKVKVNYFVGDAVNLSAKDNTYDYLFCISVLEHLEQETENGILVNKHHKKLDRLAIKEFIRVIKPGGRIILTLDYGSRNLCKDWIQCSFEFEYVKDIIEEFSANLVRPLQDFDEIRLTTERESEVKKLWSEFYPYRPQENPLFGTSLGIILTKR